MFLSQITRGPVFLTHSVYQLYRARIALEPWVWWQCAVSIDSLCRSGTSLAATDTLFTSCTSESLLLVPVVSAAVPQSCLPHRSDNTCTVLYFTSCRLYGTLVQICRTLQQLMLNTIKYLWDCSVAYLSNYTVFQKTFISRTFMTTVWNSNQFK